MRSAMEKKKVREVENECLFTPLALPDNSDYFLKLIN